MKLKFSETKLYELILLTISLVVVVYNLLTENYSYSSNLFVGLIVIICSVYNILKSRKSDHFLILGILLFYFNYSAIMYHYYIFEGKQKAFMVYANTYYCGIAINYLAIFWIFWIFCFNYKNLVIKTDNIKKSYSKPIYVIILISILLVIFIFGIDRSQSYVYTVQITPIYEYAYIFFLIAFYYSGKNKILKSVLLIFAVFFVIQDMYLGGRISTLQLAIVILLQVYPQLINIKNILIGGGGGLVFMNMVGVYRIYRNMENITLKYIVVQMFENFGILDTAYYAYYSSLTNLAFKNQIDTMGKFNNLLGFLGNIIGLDLPGYIPLTTLANINGYTNVGGGWYFSYFAFWMGGVGVMFGSVILVSTINYLNNRKRKSGHTLSYLLVVVMCASSFRWYLYTPLAFYRSMLLTIMLYLIFSRILKHKRE